jgi:beta-N-acetylglucosaminidase
VAAAQWAVLASAVMACSPPLSIYNVVRRQDLYGIAIMGGMAVYGGALWALTRSGWHLTAFPQAMLVGNAAFIGLSYILFYPLILRMRRTGQGRRSES